MKLISYLFIFTIFIFTASLSDNQTDFLNWKKSFKQIALQNDISEKTFDMTMSNVKFLPDVIKYDRYQPEFYEDTKTYISKRASSKKVSKGISFYKENSKLINTIETQYNIEKELLLALMGIETNFGTYVGKMDILSSLATLSFDKRRSEFFSNELLTLLRLIETNQIDYKTLYGSWAGAFGYFQFMPSTMKNYAIDYDKNSYIDLKNMLFYEMSLLLSNPVPRLLFFEDWINFLQFISDNKLLSKLFEAFMFNKGILISNDRLLYEAAFIKAFKLVVDNNEFGRDFILYLADIAKNNYKMVSYTMFKKIISSNLKNFKSALNH